MGCIVWLLRPLGLEDDASPPVMSVCLTLVPADHSSGTVSAAPVQEIARENERKLLIRERYVLVWNRLPFRSVVCIAIRLLSSPALVTKEYIDNSNNGAFVYTISISKTQRPRGDV